MPALIRDSKMVIGTLTLVMLSTSAKMNQSEGIGVDSQGNIFFADYYNHVIRKIDPTGLVSTFAGSGETGHADGPALSSKFTFPVDVSVDDEDGLVVADFGNYAIRYVFKGSVSTLAGSTYGTANGNASTASFSSPFGVLAVDKAIIVVERDSNIIRRIDRIIYKSSTVLLINVGIFFSGLSCWWS